MKSLWKWYRGSARMGFDKTHNGEPLWKKIIKQFLKSWLV
ncbi:unnamed protein product [Acidithrix sp. C25]|nr:unnamed protein product [Acidithrix sp. C25]CAG4934974.1 unnamed protein product [Acidithrix sp. C25]